MPAFHCELVFIAKKLQVLKGFMRKFRGGSHAQTRRAKSDCANLANDKISTQGSSPVSKKPAQGQGDCSAEKAGRPSRRSNSVDIERVLFTGSVQLLSNFFIILKERVHLVGKNMLKVREISPERKP